MFFSPPARDYRTALPIRLGIEAGRIARVETLEEAEADADLPWIAPGLVDIQVNGFGGVDFNRPLKHGQWRQACAALRAHGCTRFLATIITHSAKETSELITGLRILREAEPLNCIGFHLEGPFLNPDPGTRGAHDPAQMISPDPALFAKWQRASNNAIRLMTLAPEVDPEAALPFIQQLSTEGVRVALGHSLAMGEVLQTAVEAGAGAWTHLGNAAPRQCDKFENVVLHALAETRLRASLIPDGLHLPPHVFKALAVALGPRLLLTTDAMSGAGASGPGSFTLGAEKVEVGPDGRATLPGTAKLAGSTLTPFAGVFRAAALSGLPWTEVWDAFSCHPAHWLGLKYGLKTGSPADFCLFDLTPEPRLRAVYQDGEKG